MYDLILYRLKADELTVFIECQYDVTSDLISNLLKYKLRKMVFSICTFCFQFSLWHNSYFYCTCNYLVSSIL